MITPHSQPDDLQSLWRTNDTKPIKEDYSIMLRIAQEKQRSLQEFLHGEDSTNYLLALCLAPVFAVATWTTRTNPVMQLGNLVITLTLVAGAVITWVNHRRAESLLKIDLSVREYQMQLLQFYDRQIRFSKGIKYWYVIPLFCGISLVGYPILRHFLLPQLWSILIFAVIFAGFESYVWRVSDVKRVADLKRRKTEMQSILDDIDPA
jgi:hypothetical protein